MIGRIKYVRITDVHESQDVLQKIDCKHPDFNDFLVNDAINDTNEGKGVTYILIDEDEVKTEVSTIFAFVTTGIFLRSNESGVKLYKRKKFLDASDYIIPYDEDDKLGKCKPMYLPIFDDIENIFGI